MKASISIVVGKGSLTHNSRTFIASNVDKERVHLNHEYVNINIQQAYHSLFNEALISYNNKQTRSDRVIHNYYEKIRSGKQEKPFHEIIVQIGNKDTMNVLDDNGKLAEKVLDEYMQSFQERNPYLHVFSAHMHMDEETPHLHIDFIPFTTNSKRGLETRVSLKQALSNLGFKGGSKSETEMQQWIKSEKEILSNIMLNHNIEWEKLDNHEDHLSVLDFKKKKRLEEVKNLETQINLLENQLDEMKYDGNLMNEFNDDIHTEELWSIPEPKRFMTAKNYKEEIIIPFISKIKATVSHIIDAYFHISKQLREIRYTILPLKLQISELESINEKLYKENIQYKQKLNKISKVLGKTTLSNLLKNNKEKEQIWREEQNH